MCEAGYLNTCETEQGKNLCFPYHTLLQLISKHITHFCSWYQNISHTFAVDT